MYWEHWLEVEMNNQFLEIAGVKDLFGIYICEKVTQMIAFPTSNCLYLHSVRLPLMVAFSTNYVN